MSFLDSSFVEFTAAQEIILEELKDEKISEEFYIKKRKKYEQYEKKSAGEDFDFAKEKLNLIKLERDKNLLEISILEKEKIKLLKENQVLLNQNENLKKNVLKFKNFINKILNQQDKVISDEKILEMIGLNHKKSNNDINLCEHKIKMHLDDCFEIELKSKKIDNLCQPEFKIGLQHNQFLENNTQYEHSNNIQSYSFFPIEFKYYFNF